jgi:hypothetical protein
LGLKFARLHVLEVNMKRLRLFAATALAILASAAAAQAPEGRGNTPPGMSRDGSAPGDGAITGGSIAPGERGGMPSGRDTSAGREDALKRCLDLEGVLREQCQRDAGSAGSGGTSPARSPAGGGDIERRAAPPPQNPR